MLLLVVMLLAVVLLVQAFAAAGREGEAARSDGPDEDAGDGALAALDDELVEVSAATARRVREASRTAERRGRSRARSRMVSDRSIDGDGDGRADDDDDAFAGFKE